MTNFQTFDKARRKRSGRVVLTTMAALGGGAMLSGCGEAEASTQTPQLQVADKGEKVEVFENVFTCAKVTGKTREECADMREQAVAAAAEEAPRFEALADCEEQYGQGKCMEAGEPAANTASNESQHRSHFSPFIAAFIWSKSSSRPAPVFSAPGGGYQTGRGVRLGYGGAPGKYFAGSRPFEKARTIPKVKAASAAAKTAMGGFGEKSRGWNLNSRSGGSSHASASRGG